MNVSNSQKSNIVQEGVAVSGLSRTPQKLRLKMSLMSFFLTISDEANAGNEAVAEKDTVCQLCNGLKERTNDGSRFGFCKQRSLRQPRQPRKLPWQGGWRRQWQWRRQQWRPKVRNIKVNR